MVKQIIDGDQLAALSAGSGAGMTGPASAVDGDIAVFDGVTGKVVKDSGKKAADFAAADHTHTQYMTDPDVDSLIDDHNNQWDAHPSYAYCDALKVVTMNLTTSWQSVNDFNDYDWTLYDMRPYIKIWNGSDAGNAIAGTISIMAEVTSYGYRALYSGLLCLAGSFAAGHAEEIRLYAAQKDVLDKRLYLRMHNPEDAPGKPLLQVAYSEIANNIHITLSWKVLHWRNANYGPT